MPPNTFTPGNNSSANGVRVTTQRNNVPMILAQVLRTGPQKYEATAIAVMDFATAVGKEPPNCHQWIVYRSRHDALYQFYSGSVG